jgi:hypothetical protein
MSAMRSVRGSAIAPTKSDEQQVFSCSWRVVGLAMALIATPR